MIKSLVLVLIVISTLFVVPSAYSTHTACEEGYMEIVDPETGFTKCVFDPRLEEEIPPQLDLQFADFQEHIQLVINSKKNTSEISVLLLSTNPQDILIPPNLEDVILNSDRIESVVFTNEWQCAPSIAADPCILVQVKREGLGEFTETIQKNSREIADKIIFDSQFIGLNAEFHSIIIESGKPSQNTPPLATVVYVTKYFPTPTLVSLIADQLLNTKITNNGGFYDILNKITENNYAEFHLRLVPTNDEILRSVIVTLSTSGLPEELTHDTIKPLILLNASVPGFIDDKIYRSKYFSEGFFPLNSIFNVIVITESDYRVKNVGGGLIEIISSTSDLEKSGWFFSSNAQGKIEGRYLFGTDKSASSSDLTFSITNNEAEYLSVQIHEPAKTMDEIPPEPERELVCDGDVCSWQEVEAPRLPGQGGCLIATAAFGSELAPQVQLLREIRDNTILQTESGSAFMTEFNNFYYLFSPTIADYERENLVFKESVKLLLTPLLTSLTLLQFADIDSETDMMVYGVSIILLNIVMYFVAPTVFILKLVRKL